MKVGVSLWPRPTQKKGRTYVNKVLAPGTTSRVAHTVTAGKKFYLTGLSLQGYNTSVGSFGDLRCRDGAAGAERIPFLAAPAVTAGTASVAILPALPIGIEPMQFRTAVAFDIVAGTINYAVSIVGYEE